MSPESQPLSRRVLTTLCAFALAAGMALPMLGTTPSYAEEVAEPLAETTANESGHDIEGANTITPATQVPEEGVDKGDALPSGTDPKTQSAASNSAKTYTVTFGTNDPQTVAPGGTVTVPTMTDTTYSINGKSVPATFVGWYQTESADSLIPVDFKGSSKFFGVDFISSKGENKTTFVNARQKANLTPYPASSSIPVCGDMTFRALYEVPVHLVTLGIYAEGSFAVCIQAKVIEGDPFVSSEEWRSLSAGYTIEKWSFENEAFDVNTTPITTDIIINGIGADGWAKSMVKAYITQKPSGSSIPVSGSTGVSASGKLIGPNIPANTMTTVGATAVTSGEAYMSLTSLLGDKLFGNIMNVSIMVDGKEIHDGFGSLTLSFPVGEANNGRWITVHHRHNDGRITSERTIAENGMATVTVTDLSAFALEVGGLAESGSSDTKGTALKTNTSALAKTGDSLAGSTSAIVAAIALGAVGFAGYRSRKSIKK
ncbi:MAG: hypothetical protein RSA14_00275 [Raoultibacter sp.]